jgi:hypothetical protein
LAGKFSGRLAPIILCLFFGAEAFAGPGMSYNFKPRTNPANEWGRFETRMRERQELDRIDGLSYLISGSLALVGGLAGQNISADPLEKGVYTVFQTIGVASIGYGIYKWRLGDEERWMYETLSMSEGLTPAQKAAVMKSYYEQKKDRERREKIMRAITHGLIAGLNFYGATQQKSENVKNALIFLGGVNTLAVISFTF